jgi:hypothetical protein
MQNLIEKMSSDLVEYVIPGFGTWALMPTVLQHNNANKNCTTESTLYKINTKIIQL